MRYIYHTHAMLLIEIGRELKRLRVAAGLTQAQLAQLAGVARETVSRIENGAYNDIGVKKLQALLELVGGELVARPAAKSGRPDFIRRAVSTANTSLRDRLYADELVQALVTGNVPPGREGHLKSAFEELSAENLAGLIGQVGELASDSDRVETGARRLRNRLGIETP